MRIHDSLPSVAMTNRFAALLLLTGFLTAAAPINKPQFNLFLNHEQSRTFLGLSIELFYVKEGSINDYALRFPVPVPADTHQVVFNWQNTRPQIPLNYRLETSVDDLEAMHLPKVDIPSRGLLPNSVQEFSAKLSCTGKKTAEVRITISISVSNTESFDEGGSTVVKIYRKKVCFKNDHVLEVTTTTTESPTEMPEDDDIQDEEEPEDVYIDDNALHAERIRKHSLNSTMTIDSVHVDHGPVLLAVGGIAFLVAAACMALSAFCYLKNKKLRQAQTNIMPQAGADKYFQEWSAVSSTIKTQNGGYGIITSSNLEPLHGQRIIRVGSPVASTVASYSSFRKASPPLAPSPMPFINYYNTLHSSQGINSSLGQYSTINDTSSSSLLSEQIAELAVDPRCFTFVKLLNEGAFGRVYHALLNEGSNGAVSQSVMVKTVTEQASVCQTQLFLQEGMMLFGMDHANILPVVRSCVDTPTGQPVLMYPFMSEGNLKQFLRRSKFSQTECGHHCLTTRDLVDMGVQIAEGIKFLHRRFFLHKDIATRNCMVDERLHVKITDNALSRDIFPDDYNCLGDNENRPVKWMAIESLQNREFTFASDLWMFGVTLWELVTLGQQPYPEIDPFDIGVCLTSGYRLAQPANCPDELYEVMERCWSASPGERLTLPQILRTLASFYNHLDSYI